MQLRHKHHFDKGQGKLFISSFRLGPEFGTEISRGAGLGHARICNYQKLVRQLLRGMSREHIRPLDYRGGDGWQMRVAAGTATAGALVVERESCHFIHYVVRLELRIMPA